MGDKNENVVEIELEFIPDREDLAIFWRLYETEFNFHAPQAKFEKLVLGKIEKNKRLCRFCGKDSTTTTFRKTAHALPVLLGNKYLFSNYECDACNSIFGRYESELANFSGAWHTLSLVQGRNGVPKFKDKKSGFHMLGQDGKLGLYIDRSDGKNGGVEITQDDSKLSIKTFKPAFVPRDVVKCFVKIGLTLMEAKYLDDYDETRRWLIGEIPEKDVPMHPYFLIPKALTKKHFADPIVMLMRRRNVDLPFAVPEHCLLLFYGVFVYQVFIPFNRNEEAQFKKGKLCLPIEEHLCKEVGSMSPLGEAQVNIMNMGASRKVKGVEENIVLPFQKL